MKTTFFLSNGKVRDCDDETSLRKAADFEFEFEGCPAVDTTDLRNAMIEYRDSLNNHADGKIIYQKRAEVERQSQFVYRKIYEAMK